MQGGSAMHIHRIGDVTVLNDHAEVPGLGFVPVNAFVLHTGQPVVIDTGLSTADKDFVSVLAEVLNPADVRWLWITHPDRDHTGGLWPLLEAAPTARLVTPFSDRGSCPSSGRSPSTGSSCLIRARLSSSVTATCTPSARRCSTVPRPPGPSTPGPGCCSARTASAPQCRRRSWRHQPTYVRSAARFATYSCYGRPSTAGAPGRPGKVSRHGRPAPCHGRLGDFQHPPAVRTAAGRPALRNSVARGADKPVRRPRPGGTGGPARYVRACRAVR